ncbi:amino-acid N-acetyltransferase [Luminiphilus sp.]|nr:amino-acid N-acetyltransferase [Luminiphilus sp.]MDB2511118.1 amino-acid N-acetyltransferase [Luminiphilus sp.]MDB2692369.1 amino-acid N-acetyltransferase [Luminiphilus sp.]
MAELTTQTDTLDWFRNTAPYINTHRGTTVVVGLRHGATTHHNFINVVHDLALMQSLGLRLVIVHEHQPMPLTPVPLEAMETLIASTLDARTQIERMFSMGLPNSPLHNAKLRVISGNFVTARPVGVINGVDHGARGLVRHIDVGGITHALDGSSICLLSALGYSPAGELFALDALDVMRVVGRSIGADKLIIMSDFNGIEAADGSLYRQLTVDSARSDVVAATAAQRECIELACDACDTGIPRAHLISFQADGGLLKELYTHDGVGTMISSDEYEQLKPAEAHDLAGIIELIRPLQREGVLAERSNDQIERDLMHYTVVTKDSRVIACAALIKNNDSDIAEIASVATHTDYRDSGWGERLIERLVQDAKESNISRVYVRTTQTGHWFQELGFKAVTETELPDIERQKAQHDRNSNILVRSLG